MQLLVIQNGLQQAAEIGPLAPGKQGNVQTIALMLPMIRADVAQNLELRRFAESLIVECGRDWDCRANALFEFAKSIRYDNDPIGVERIADATTTIEDGWGDCGDKTILLASLMGTIGILTRLVKVNFYNDLGAHGYDHLYLEAQRPDGSWEAFDPTPENAPPGQEIAAAVRDVEEIWPATLLGQIGNLAGAGSVAVTGATIGLSFVPVVGPFLAALVGPLASLFHGKSPQEIAAGRNFDSLDHDVAAFFGQINGPGVTQVAPEDFLAAQNAVAALEHLAQQTSSVAYVRSQWAAEQPRYAAALQDIARKVVQASPIAGGAAGATTLPGTGSGLNQTIGGVSTQTLILAGIGIVALVLYLKS